VALFSDLSTIKKYIKNIDAFDLEDIIAPRLPQLKSYLKILDIPYLIEDTNILITSDIVKKIIKSTHIFNDVVFILKPRVIKASSKSDIAVVWVNIWDAQSSIKAKGLINMCFNVGSYIAIV